ncbi:MAG: hypothetical protein ACYC65_11160 [Candidatus Limnocylindrales bacterium]
MKSGVVLLALALLGSAIFTAGCGSKAAATATPEATPYDLLGACGFRPRSGADPYAGDVHPMVNNDRNDPDQLDLLAGQPADDAQLVWCENLNKANWIVPPAPAVWCEYSGANGQGRVSGQLGQERQTFWVVEIATGRLIDYTILTGPVPTQENCPDTVQGTGGNDGDLWAWATIPGSQKRDYLQQFIQGPVRPALASPPSFLLPGSESITPAYGNWPGASLRQITPGGGRTTLDAVLRDPRPRRCPTPVGSDAWIELLAFGGAEDTAEALA